MSIGHPYDDLKKEEKLKRLEELQEQIEELKQNMNADEVIEANEREIWEEKQAHLKKTNPNAQPFPLGLILWVGFMLFMLYLLFAN